MIGSCGKNVSPATLLPGSPEQDLYEGIIGTHSASTAHILQGLLDRVLLAVMRSVGLDGLGVGGWWMGWGRWLGGWMRWVRGCVKLVAASLAFARENHLI